jgi:Mg-chelatase subunit ChlD
VIAAVGFAVAIAAFGLLLVRSGTPAARSLQWAVVLAFAVVVLLRPREVAHAQAVAAAVVVVPDSPTPTAARTALLVAAAHGEAAAEAVRVDWRPGLPVSGQAPFGAVTQAPAPWPVPPEQVQVRALAAPTVARPLRLQLDAPRREPPCAATLLVFDGDTAVLETAVQLGAEPPPEVAFTPATAREHRLELRLDHGGRRLWWQGRFAVAAAAPVLVVEPSGLAAAALRAQDVPVQDLAALPADLRPFPALVLGTVPDAVAQARLVAAVGDGLGLLVLGPAFAAEGAPVRSLLPMRPRPAVPAAGGREPLPAPGPGNAEPPPSPSAEPPPAGDVPPAPKVGDEPIEVDKHAIAMVLLVDRSGSMGAPLRDGATKMSYAKTSALRTAQALGGGDEVGIVTFGTKNEGRIELPLVAVTATAEVQAGIERLAHQNEMTFLLSGLQRANEMLQASKAAVKHVVVVSDGEFDRNEMVALFALAHRMRTGSKITLSVISIVDSFTHPAFVRGAERLAQDGGGQFLTVTEPGTIPAFVAAEVTRSLERVGRKPRADGSSPTPSGKPVDPAPVAPPSEPVPAPRDRRPQPAELPTTRPIVVRAVAESPLLAPRPDPDWPALAAAVAGDATIDAHVLLVAGDEGWPLLAFGNRGLGRVGAFAADLFGPAGAEFRTERAFPGRFAQWLQNVQPGVPQSTPQPLLHGFASDPPIPTPAELVALHAFSGEPPTGSAAPADRPLRVQRQRRSAVAETSVFLLLALLLQALGERWFAARAARTGLV